jgi:capsular exopolysaccharide synthesis family protein
MSSLIASSSQLPSGSDLLFASRAAERSRPKELFGIIMQRLRPALVVGASVMALVVAGTFAMPKMYAAHGSVLIEPKRENIAKVMQDPQDTGSMPPDTAAIDTQVEVLRSHALAQAVAQRLKLYDDPEFNPFLHGAPAGHTPSPRELQAVADSVQGHTQIKRSGLTYAVDVGVASKSPDKAAVIANTYMDVFLDRQLEEKVAEVTKANTQIGGELERMRQEAETAQERVQQYKIANNLYSAEGATMAEQEVSALNQQIAQAEAESAEKQAKAAAALEQVRRGSGGADVSAAVGSDTIKELRKEEAEKSAQLALLQSQFKPEYPEVKRVQAEVDELRAEIQQELNRIMSSVKADASASAQRAGSLLASRSHAQGGLVANNRAMVGLIVLQQRADAAKAVYDAYLARAKEVAAEGALQQPDAVINSPATKPLKPYSPNKKLGVVFGFLLGLFSAAITILVTELWDKRLRSRTDIEMRLGVPFAGVLPDTQTRGLLGKRIEQNSALVAKQIVDNRFSGFAESFRNLRAFLNFAGGPSAKLLAVTSSLPGEGKSVTSLCLARTLALGGANTLLVDCDLRRRGISKTIGEAGAGLAEVIQGKASLDQALVRDAQSGAWVLPASADSPAHYDLFTKPEAETLLRRLGERFDHVILDLPPVLGVADARIVAAMADRVLYLVRWNSTPARTAQSGLEVLRECGANVVGAVLSQVDVDQQARYGYCDSSDYFKHYRQYYLPSAGR